MTSLSALYSGAVTLRGKMFDRGWLRVRSLDVPVISIGNLTTGGSGKSPMTAWMAGMLARMNQRPVVVSRGYGGRHTGPATVVSEGEGPLVTAEVGGDEPVMLARRLTGVPVIVSHTRFDGGSLAISRYDAGCILLDDGFQHRSLHRDFDLLLVSGTDPFGNGRLLPAGPLREPLTAMGRADAVIVTRSDRAARQQLDTIGKAASRYCPNAPVLHSRSLPVGLFHPGSGETTPLAGLNGRKVVCFAGIANPNLFFSDLRAAGAEVVAEFPFADHHPYSRSDRERLVTAAADQAEFIVTTEKDLARLQPPYPGKLRALRIETPVDEEDTLMSLLEKVLP